MRRNRTRFVLFSLRAIQFLAHEVGKQRGSVELRKTKHRFHRVERFQLINRACATLGIEKESGCKSCGSLRIKIFWREVITQLLSFRRPEYWRRFRKLFLRVDFLSSSWFRAFKRYMKRASGSHLCYSLT